MVSPCLPTSGPPFYLPSVQLSLKLNMQTMTMKKEMESPIAADFSAYEGKIDASVISQVQAIYESELAAAQSGEDPNAAELARIEKEISAMFHGPDGAHGRAQTSHTPCHTILRSTPLACPVRLAVLLPHLTSSPRISPPVVASHL